MPRSVLLRLIDIRDAIDGIVNTLSDASFNVYEQNWAMQRAAERGLEIISEASRHVADEYKALAPEIPWRQIAAIGNLLRHEQRTDSSAIWNIVTEHLPALSNAVDGLIEVAEKREGS